MSQLSKFGQWICLGLCVGLILLSAIFPARASVESRLSNIEADFRQLERRIDRLSTEVNRLDRGSDSGQFDARTTPSESDIESSTLADDPMFDRLATLVIELKLRVDEFEERLDEIESAR
ncbi:MAG: hypothetical protein SWY16_07725 [Cyanobacteriota bacterium]|nr:hypothetical protein [Cyanobacteriota bacterium]